MRVLFLNITAELGGAERLLLDVLASLGSASSSLERHLLLAEDGPVRSMAQDLGVTTHLLSIPASISRLGDFGLWQAGQVRRVLSLLTRSCSASFAVWNYARKLGRKIDQINPDIVHSNSLKFHFLSRLAVHRGRRTIWHLHDFLTTRTVMRRGLGWASGRLSAAVAVSQAVADDAASVLARVPIFVVPNGIDLKKFSPDETASIDLDRLANLPPASARSLRVGLIATYARWKGQDVFLEAARQLVDAAPDLPVRFYIIGGPIYRTASSQWSVEQLRRLAGELIGRHQLGLIPFQSNSAPIYRALDVVVHASTQPEPFGLTIVEAMASGKPVVVSRAGGAIELFQEDFDAVSVAPGDGKSLAELIKSLLLDPERRERLGKQARISAVTKFSRERLGPQLIDVYRGLLQA